MSHAVASIASFRIGKQSPDIGSVILEIFIKQAVWAPLIHTKPERDNARRQLIGSVAFDPRIH